MKKIMILAAGIGLLATGNAIAQPGPASGRAERGADITRDQMVAMVDARFARMDANRDGRATPDELRAAHQQRRGQRLGHRFERMDRDDNGQVSRGEFDQARTERQARRAERGERHAGRRGGGARGARMFGQQGFVTREQMRERALARFERLDTDRNGILTADERRRGRDGHRGRPGRRG